MLPLSQSEHGWHCGDKTVLQKTSRIHCLSQDPLSLETLCCLVKLRAFLFARASPQLFIWDHRLSTTDTSGCAGSLNQAQLRTSFLQGWYVAMLAVTHHRGTVVPVSLLSQVSIGIHLACCPSALLADSSSSCVIAWEWCYGNPFWFPLLVAFTAKYHGLIFLSSFEGVFPGRNFGLHCFHLQPICCYALTGTYKKKPRSLLGISFTGQALDHPSILLWAKPCLFLCVCTISPCIFKLRISRFELLFLNQNSVFEPQGREKHWEQTCQSYSELSVCCVCCRASQQQAHKSVETVVTEQVFQSCFSWLFSSHTVILSAGEGMAWSHSGWLPFNLYLFWSQMSKTGCCVAAGTFSEQSCSVSCSLHPFCPSQDDDRIFFDRLM